MNVEVKPKKDDAGKADIIIQAYADNPKAARFHIFGSAFMEADSNASIYRMNNNNISARSFAETPIFRHQSIFLNNRKLGDEYVYVLDRKSKIRYMGNTLDRPQILLKRTFVRDTDTSKENLASGEEFNLEKGEKHKMRDKPRKPMPCSDDYRSHSSSQVA